ncbi:AAA family ATPase [Caulobacter vibrioides]|uniref:AAA family ATPase n=1 Tax=Caulobacter vibrioides TaxID=155892 RepID=UPI000BB4A0AB|nr:AAA family ATPase [Caulobacter vibrioides]ATC23713.1 DNA repair protein RadA [Caulobacter vibrioides]PLR11697.1 DNA repair protein RadA [Caulobacter vibrioides]
MSGAEIKGMLRAIDMMNLEGDARANWISNFLDRKEIEVATNVTDPASHIGPVIPPLRALELISNAYKRQRPRLRDLAGWLSEQLSIYPLTFRSKPPPPPSTPWKSATTLMAESFPPVKWIAPGFFPQGLVVLGGKPKLGKSFMVLNLAVAVATGSEFLGATCEAGDVLYLALEDTERRLKDRLTKMAGPADIARLDIITRLPDEDAMAAKTTDQWLAAKPNPRLIIVDVLQKVRPALTRSDNSYAADYAAIAPWKDLADKHDICVVLIHHTRKMPADDPLETLSGTNGLTGAADCIMVLDRSSAGVALVGRGRDVEEFNSAVRHDPKTGRWILLGDGDSVFRSDERTSILRALREGAEPMGPREIAEAVGAPDANVRKLLASMVRDGQVAKQKYGKYAACDHTTHTDHTGWADEWIDEAVEALEEV